MDLELASFVAERRDDLQAARGLACEQGLAAEAVPLEHLEANVQRVLRFKAEQDDLDLQGLARFWRVFTEVHTTFGDSILADLVWSLACEQHPDSRVPGGSAEAASSALGALVARLSEPMKAFLLQRSSGAWSIAEDAVTQAWSQAFLAWWSPEAGRRFRGTGRLRVSLCTTVLRVARDLRETAPGEPEEIPDVVDESPAAGEDGELSAAVRECIERLPPKRRIVAHRAWVGGERTQDIAACLGIGKSGVAQAKAKARPTLEECLREKGFDEASLEEVGT